MSSCARFRSLAASYALALAIVVMSVCPAWAESEDVAALEKLLDAQQQRIDVLRGQLAAAAAPDDTVREAAMREQVRALLSDAAFREELAPPVLQAGYNQGFFIRSSDEKFEVSFHGRMQLRFTHYAHQARNHYLQPRLERDDQTGFEVKRIRFHVTGHVFSPDLTYFVKWMGDAPIGYDMRLLYAYFNYRFMDEFQMKFGLFQLAGTRATFNSSANMQFPEYPVVDAVFSTGTGVGVRFWGQAFDSRLEYFLDVINSLNGPNNRTITPDPSELDGNMAVAARAVWHACGEVPTRDFVAWGDVDFKEVPCLDLGCHYAFTDDYGDARNTRIPFKRSSLMDGGFGVTTADGLQINQFGIDGAFKLHGFSLSGEYILRLLDVRRAGRAPFAPLWQLTGEDSTVAQHGGYIQTGYFLPIPGFERKIEAVARVGGIVANTEGVEGTWTYAAGLNYYIQSNRVKLQTDVVKVEQVPVSARSWLGDVNDNALIWRVQLQVAF